MGGNPAQNCCPVCGPLLLQPKETHTKGCGKERLSSTSPSATETVEKMDVASDGCVGPSQVLPVEGRRPEGRITFTPEHWETKEIKRLQMKQSDPRRSRGFSKPPSMWMPAQMSRGC